MIKMKLEVITIIIVIISFGFKKHPLRILICLELLCLLNLLITIKLGIDTFLGLVIICIGACEGAVGLGTLIRITRVKMISL